MKVFDLIKDIFFILFIWCLSYQSCYTQQIEKVTYSFSGGTWRLLHNKFTVDLNSKLLYVESYDTSITTHQLTNKKIKSLVKMIQPNKLDQIPDSTKTGIDGSMYFLEIEYDDQTIKAKKAWSAFRDKKFIALGEFFEKYSRREEKDYFYL